MQSAREDVADHRFDQIPPGGARKWITAVLNAWENAGHAGLSARSLAQTTGLPASSIYHHFGDLEQLYGMAQDHARTLAQRWCDERLHQLIDAPAGHASLAPLLAALIDDWCEGQRDLAYAWRECQLLAARDPRYAPSAERWRSLWANFWRDVCDRLDIAQTATLTARLFDGESFLHMIRWRRSIDRAVLDETCRGWANWLGGTPAPAAPWREAARTRALQSGYQSQPRDPISERVETAAATMLARSGVAGVTHRAVAAEAGLTLGVVSHKFKKSADLLSAAFDIAYRLAVPISDAELETLRHDRDALRRRFGDRNGTEAFRLVAAELMLATTRDPALAPFAAQLRYLRGQTSGRALRALFGPDRPVSELDAAIFSSFAIGQGNSFAGMAEEERHARSVAETEMLLGLLHRK